MDYIRREPLDNAAPQPRLDRRGESIAALLLLLLAGMGLGLLFLSRFLGSVVVAGLSWYCFFGALTAACAFVQFRVYRVTGELKRQEETLRSRVGAESLFARMGGADPDARLSHTRRVLTILAHAVVLVGSFGLTVHFFTTEKPPAIHPAAGSVFCALAAFVSYVVGRYLTVLASSSLWRPLRTVGTWLSAGGALALVCAAAFAAGHAGWDGIVFVLDRVVPVFFLLLGADMAGALLGQAYGLGARDPEPGRSRVVELIGLPAEATRSIGDALTYNFGVRLTAATVRGFAAGVVLPFLAVSAVVFLALSCFAWIDEGHVGFVERLGTLRDTPLVSGLHCKAPWPFDHVRVEQVSVVRVEGIGPHFAGAHAVDGEKRKDDGHDHDSGGKVLSWTEEHGDGQLFLTPAWGEEADADAMGLVALSASIRFCVADPRLFAYDGAVEPDEVTRLCFRRALVHVVAATDPLDFFGPARYTAVERVSGAVSALAAPYGVRVLDVTLDHVHMPVEVVPEFERVARMRAQKQAVIAAAEAEKDARYAGLTVHGQVAGEGSAADARSVAGVIVKSRRHRLHCRVV